MFIDDFDLKIHLYGDENNFGLLNIDDGRLNGDKEHDEKIYNKLPQASFPINHMTSEKIGKAIANYVETYLTYVEESDYSVLLTDYTISSVDAIEFQINSFIHSVFFDTEYSEPEVVKIAKYVSISFVRIFSFEYFFLTFNPVFKNKELIKVMNELTKLIYGNNKNKLIYAVQNAITNIAKESVSGIEELEERSFICHSDVLRELKERDIFKLINLDETGEKTQFKNFITYFILCKPSKNSVPYSKYVFYTSPEIMSMILSKLNPQETNQRNAIKLTPEMYVEEMIKEESLGYYFMDARKKKDGYEFRYGLKKKN